MAINQHRTLGLAASQTSTDAGLRSYMLRVYNYMSMGIGLTAIITLVMTLNVPLMQTIAIGPAKFVLFVGLLGLGWMAPRLIMTKSQTVAHGAYWLYAALWGVLISPMIYMFLNTPGGVMDIVRAFLITSGMFAGMSIYGYTTKRDLGAFGKFFMMATIGLLIALVVNIFVGSSMLSLLISGAVVLVFAGITAYETQMVRNLYFQAQNEEMANRMAIFGAFALYGTFITMFIHILSIIGIMRRD